MASPQIQVLATKIAHLRQALATNIDPATLEAQINDTRTELERSVTRAQADEEHAARAVDEIEKQLREEFGTSQEEQLQAIAEKLQTEINTAQQNLANWCRDAANALNPRQGSA